MKNTELRIGNLVEIYGKVETVVDVMCDSVNTLNIEGAHYGLVNPVPLTEDWLLRLGFEKKQPNCTWYRKNRVTINVFNDVAFRLNTNCNYVYKPFKHVHQLQNLYFSLTGEELTTKN
jgi:hypothetical protein